MEKLAANSISTGDLDTGMRLSLSTRNENGALLRQVLTGFAEATELSALELGDLSAGVTEAFTNAARHAYGGAPGRVEICVSAQPGTVDVLVRDAGRGLPHGFEATDAFPTVVGRELSGLGIPLIISLTDVALWRPAAGGGAEVLMRFPVGSGADRAEYALDSRSVVSAGHQAETIVAVFTPLSLARRALPRLLRACGASTRLVLARETAMQNVLDAVLEAYALTEPPPTHIRAAVDCTDTGIEWSLWPLATGSSGALAQAARTAHPSVHLDLDEVDGGGERVVIHS